MQQKVLKHKETSGGGIRRNGNLHTLLYQNAHEEVLSVSGTVFGGRVLKRDKLHEVIGWGTKATGQTGESQMCRKEMSWEHSKETSIYNPSREPSAETNLALWAWSSSF